MYSTSFLAYECELYNSDHLTGHETSPTGRPLKLSVCRSSRAVRGMCCCCFRAVKLTSGDLGDLGVKDITPTTESMINGACLMFQNRHWNIRGLQLISYTKESCCPRLALHRYLVVRESTIGRCWIDRFGCRFPPFALLVEFACVFSFMYHGCWPWMWQTCTFSQVFEADWRWQRFVVILCLPRFGKHICRWESWLYVQCTYWICLYIYKVIS